MHLTAPAIVLAVRAHGEAGAIVRALTREEGVLAGYVRGGRSRRLRPVLQPANVVLGEWRARTAEQLPALTVELVRSRAALQAEPLAEGALEWLAALTAAALPEAQRYPRLHDALAATLDAVEAAPSAKGWAGSLARYELLLLGELGFGVGPARLNAAPTFLREGAAVEWADILAGLRLTGRLLERDILVDRRAETLAARERLVDRLRRAA